MVARAEFFEGVETQISHVQRACRVRRHQIGVQVLCALPQALIPADGYYEWHTVGKTKTPYYIHPPEGIITFAGLYSWWRDPTKAEDDPERWVLTATILTTNAHGELAEIHDRVPLVVPSDFWPTWLDPETVGDQGLVDAAIASSTEPTERLEWHRVGSVRDNGPHLIQPVG